MCAAGRWILPDSISTKHRFRHSAETCVTAARTADHSAVGSFPVGNHVLRAARHAAPTAPGVACDTGFSAAELAVQAEMMSIQRITKSHWQREDWLESWTEHGNSPAAHITALQQLPKYRSAARSCRWPRT